MSDFPFPFFGAGEADYSGFAFVEVLFQRSPSEREREELRAGAPPPFDEFRFTDEHLFARTPDPVHLALIELYEADEDGAGDTEIEGVPRAAASKVRKFNQALDDWLLAAHDVCPIRLAGRAPHRSAGGTRLSQWHRWSMERAEALLKQNWDPSTDLDEALDGLMELIISFMQADGLPVPPAHLDWVEPGAAEAQAIRRGDVDGLRRRLDGRLDRHDEAFGGIRVMVDDSDADQLRTLLRASDVLLPNRASDQLADVLLAAAFLFPDEPAVATVLNHDFGGSTAGLRHDVGRMLLNGEELDAARRAFEASLAAPDATAATWGQCSLAYIQSQMLEDARDITMRGLKKFPGDAWLYQNLCYCCVVLEDLPAQAADQVEQNRDLILVDDAIFENVLAALNVGGRSDSAVRLLKFWQKKKRRKLPAKVLNNVVIAYYQSGMDEEAEAALARAKREALRPLLLHTEARFAVHLGDLERARRVAQDAIDLGYPASEIHSDSKLRALGFERSDET